MAAVFSQDSVTFVGTSPENISYAKEFWKAIDTNHLDIKSTLHVTGINHRLPTAPVPAANSISPNYFHQSIDERRTSDQEEHAGLLNNSNEAQRRLTIEEDEYVNRVLHQKKQQQDLLSKQKQERLQKEAVRENIMVDEMYVYDDEKSVDNEDEAIQAMNDIDEFDRMVKLAKEQQKERKCPI